MFAHHKSDKGLTPRIYRELLKLDINNKKFPDQKRAEGLYRHFPKKTYKWPIAREKTLHVTNCQDDANETHSETPLHTR